MRVFSMSVVWCVCAYVIFVSMLVNYVKPIESLVITLKAAKKNNIIITKWSGVKK